MESRVARSTPLQAIFLQYLANDACCVTGRVLMKCESGVRCSKRAGEYNSAYENKLVEEPDDEKQSEAKVQWSTAYKVSECVSVRMKQN